MSIVIGAILYFMFSSFVYAQDTNIAEQMALNNAVEIAIKNNPGILIAQKELELFCQKTSDNCTSKS